MGEFPNKATQFDGKPGPGRPPGSVNLRTLLQGLLAEGKLGEARALWEAQWAKAVQGDTPAAKFIVESADGLQTQRIEKVDLNNQLWQQVLSDMSEWADSVGKGKQFKEFLSSYEVPKELTGE
jgi:hypothetical protein